MTVHRPHPISGPWPFAVATDQVFGRYGEPGCRIALVDRVPERDSLIYDDPEDALLFDACDRCAQHASAEGFGTLDEVKFGELWSRMVQVERNDGYYRTATEAAACRRMYEMACVLERATQRAINPWSWPLLLRADNGFEFALTSGVILNVSAVDMHGSVWRPSGLSLDNDDD